ncbi:MAG: hypothetical protein J6X28_05895 [Bacilli bacterium]|nr:hypothetical protein [Bacilli bacterium]
MKNKMIDALVILAFIIGLLFFLNYKKAYPTLKEAVRATSGGGQVEDKIKCKKGYYVFIKNSNVITSGYYYENNKKWYYDSNIVKKNYQVNDNIDVSVYYLVEENISVLEITQKEKEQLVLSDSENSIFIEKKEKEKEYMTAIKKKLNQDYTLTCNEKEYQFLKQENNQ